MRLLIVEDDPDVVLFLRRGLERSGHAVDSVDNGVDAIWMATEVAYDAVLLDVNVPEPDGYEICRRLRDAEMWSPIIFLTGRDDVADRVIGLDAGADDYLVKPVTLAELEARMRAVSRRGRPERPSVMRVGDLAIDPGSHTASRGQVSLNLTPKEFVLLEILARRSGQVVSRTELQAALWDFAFEARSNVVEVLIRRLRQKVDVPFGRDDIRTARGVGYSLRVADAAPLPFRGPANQAATPPAAGDSESDEE